MVASSESINTQLHDDSSHVIRAVIVVVYYHAAIKLAKYGKLNLNYNYIKINIIF